MALPLFQMLWKLGAPQRRRNTICSRRVGSKKSRVAIWRRRFPVAVNYVANKDAADRVVHDITSIGGRAVAIHADVAREEEILRLFEVAERQLGPIGGLVNNAAITGGITRVELRKDAIGKVLAVNIACTMLCSRE